MPARHGIRASSLVRTAALALLAGAMAAACERTVEPPAAEAGAEMNWARAALERNPDLEVLAMDTDAGVFTLRNRRTGEVQAVKLADIAAAPAARLAATAAPAATAYRAPPAEVPPAATLPAPEDEAVTGAEDAALPGTEQFDYTIERQGGGIRVSGPGVSIVSAAAPEAASARGEAGQQTVDPFICEGPRMMQFDNRRIFVDGDAITARKGCELHITNSRIVASGTGVVVQNAAVHVSNSYIEGRDGAYYAGPGARIFLRTTTLNGVRRRDDSAEVRELTEGEWR